LARTSPITLNRFTADWRRAATSWPISSSRCGARRQVRSPPARRRAKLEASASGASTLRRRLAHRPSTIASEAASDNKVHAGRPSRQHSSVIAASSSVNRPMPALTWVRSGRRASAARRPRRPPCSTRPLRNTRPRGLPALNSAYSAAASRTC